MKVRQIIEAGEVIIEAGEVKSFYMFFDNEMDLTFEGGQIKLSLPEDVMKRLHQRLGEKLTKLAEERLADAKELVETEVE